MSVINKMLQELDRRHAMGGAPNGRLPPRQVRAVAKSDRGHEWFWRTLAGLLVVAVGWVLWVSYHMQPRALVTDQAFKAAERAERRVLLTPPEVPPAPQVPPLLQLPGLGSAAPAPGESQPSQAAAPATPVTSQQAGGTIQPATQPVAPAQPAIAPIAAATAPAPAAKPASIDAAATLATPDLLRLALSIETPIRPRPRASPARQPETENVPEAAPAARAAEPAPKPAASRPAGPVQAAAPSEPARVEKRERVRSGTERAEIEFRRGVALLNQGRSSEADEAFGAALSNDASHRAARQARIALLLEQRRLDDARRLLQEGLAVDPTYTPYSLVLARIFIERGDLPGSLEVLNAAKAHAGGTAEFNALFGNVLQRLAKHREAADAYRDALRLAPEAGVAWVGLGLSLEALEHRPEAAEAFRRAVATGSLNADLQAFAEQRARVLQR